MQQANHDNLSSNAFLFLSYVFSNQKLESIFTNKFASKDNFLCLLEQHHYTTMIISLFEVFNTFYSDLDLPFNRQQPKISNKMPAPSQKPTQISEHARSYQQQIPQILQESQLAAGRRKKTELELSIREIIQKDFQPLKRQISQPKATNPVEQSSSKTFQQSLEQLFKDQNIDRFSFGVQKEDILKKEIKEKVAQMLPVPIDAQQKLTPPRAPSRVQPKSPSEHQSPNSSRNFIAIDELPKKKKSSVSSQRSYNILNHEEIS